MAANDTTEAKQAAAEAAQAEADKLAQEAKVIPTAEPSPLDRTRVSRVVTDEDGDGQTDQRGDTTTLAVVEVLIERSNNEKVSAEVYEVEVPILQAVHGEMSVTVGDHIYDVEFEGDANDLYRAFVRKYNSPQAGEPVQAAYRNAKALAEEAGMTVGSAKTAPASVNEDGRRKATAKKAVAKKASKK